MSIRHPLAITVTATGTRTATSGTSAGTTLPNGASGAVPPYVRVAATVAAHFRMGVGAQTAVTTDIMVQPDAPVILVVPPSYTHYAVIQDSAAGVVTVTPVEG